MNNVVQVLHNEAKSELSEKWFTQEKNYYFHFIIHTLYDK